MRPRVIGKMKKYFGLLTGKNWKNLGILLSKALEFAILSDLWVNGKKLSKIQAIFEIFRAFSMKIFQVYGLWVSISQNRKHFKIILLKQI